MRRIVVRHADRVTCSRRGTRRSPSSRRQEHGLADWQQDEFAALFLQIGKRSQELDQGIDPLTDDQLFRQLPVSHRICRVYVPKEALEEEKRAVASALDALLGCGVDDLTNM